MPKYLKGDTVAITAKVLSVSSDDDLEKMLTVLTEGGPCCVPESSIFPKSHKQCPAVPGDFVIQLSEKRTPEPQYRVLHSAWGHVMCRVVGTDTVLLLKQDDLEIVQRDEPAETD